MISNAVLLNKIENVERIVTRLEEKFDEMDRRITCVEKDNTALNTRLSVTSYVQIGISVIIGAIASFLGGRKV